MKLNQLLKYLELNMAPDSGAKVEVFKNDNIKSIKIYIYNSKTYSFDYIFKFTSENKVSIISGYTNIEYTLDFQQIDGLFESIELAVKSADHKHLKSLEDNICSFESDSEDV